MLVNLLILFAVSSVIFLALDAVMLSKVIQPLFQKHLGQQMYEGGFRTGPAIAFYAVNMIGILYFAAWPALLAGDPMRALIDGAILGLVAYGCYELTSWTVMQDWHPSMVATDLPWGIFLTAVSAFGGVWITLAITS